MKNIKKQDMDLEVVEGDEKEEAEVAIEYDVTTYPSDYNLLSLKKLWDDKDILIPDFQREFVWSLKQSSMLIESFLLGLPVPPVFFYVDEYNKNLVIDGQQRILSIIFFLNGYFGADDRENREDNKQRGIVSKRRIFRLKGINEKSPYYNKTFKELDSAARRKLESSSVLRAFLIRQLAPKEKVSTSAYHIFERLNTGGTPLKPQEIRNCVFRGDLIKVLRELNSNSNWRKILGKDNFDKHQKDVELILRVFALSKHVEKYEKPMKEFLNKTMEKEKAGNSQRVLHFKERFLKAAKIIIEKLGEKPFHLRGPLNASVLDSVFCTILDHLEKIPDDLQKRYKKLSKDSDFVTTTFHSTSDFKVLHKRFEVAFEYLIKP